MDKPTGTPSLHKVGLSFTLEPVQPLRYCFQSPDEQLQTSISDVEGDDCDKKDDHCDLLLVARKERTKARRAKKLDSRRERLGKEWSLSAEELLPEIGIHPLVVGEEPGQSTERYIVLKQDEGHAFGASLLNAIKHDHHRRGCECPVPRVYQGRVEAEAGVGTFRFFRHLKRSKGPNIWVFMRKDDHHWHCTCEKKPLSDFALFARKCQGNGVAEYIDRKLQADELHEAERQVANQQGKKRKASDSECDITQVEGSSQSSDGGHRRRLAFLTQAKRLRLRALSARVFRSAHLTRPYVSAEAVQSMCGSFSAGVVTMGTTVKNLFSRFKTQSKPTCLSCSLDLHLLTST